MNDRLRHDTAESQLPRICCPEARGFEPGYDKDDWLAAQSQIDAV